MVRTENSCSVFQPTSQQQLYNTSHKRNICVACGTTTGLMRHYAVPYAYRRLLPSKFKSHLPHDIVLLCLDCHIYANQVEMEQERDVYEPAFRKDPQAARPVINHQRRHTIKNCAQALWKHRHKMPPTKIIEYEAVVQAYLTETSNDKGVERDDDDVDDDVDDDNKNNNNNNNNKVVALTATTTTTTPPAVLQHLAENLMVNRPNPNYVPITTLVVESLQTDQDISNFIRSWRTLFVEILQPRYLPGGWSVESPVENDAS
jgi:hypothetical protein